MTTTMCRVVPANPQRTAALYAVGMLLLVGSMVPLQAGNPVPVKISVAKAVPEELLRDIPAVIGAQTQTRLAFRVAGQVTELLAEVGQPVTNSQLLAALDARDYDNAVQRAEAELAQAQANQQDANRYYKRIEDVWNQGMIDESELDAARAQSLGADAQSEAAQKQLEEAELQLSYTQLKAPFDGMISSRTADAFDVVASGQQVLGLTSLHQLQVVGQLPGNLIPECSRIQSISCVMPLLNHLELPARLIGVAGSAGEQTRTFEIKAAVTCPPGTVIRPGMNAILRLSVRMDGDEQGVLLPASAVVSDVNSNPYVWRIDASGKVKQCRVELGAIRGDSIQIVSGLKAGDQVVAAGVHGLKEGQSVHVMGKTP